MPTSWPAALRRSVAGSELVIAGATPGVLDAQGRSIPVLDLAGIDAADCERNGDRRHGRQTLGLPRPRLEQGLSIIRLVDGRTLGAPHGVDDAPGRRSWPRSGRPKAVHKKMTTTPTTDVPALESQHVLQTYRRLPVVFERGEGMRLFDDHGRAYLDFVSGIGVESLGHAHPALARALAEQAATLLHTSNLYFHPLQGELAARALGAHGPRARVLLQQRHRGRWRPA